MVVFHTIVLAVVDWVVHDCVPRLLHIVYDTSCSKLDSAPWLLRGDSNTLCCKVRLDKFLEHFAVILAVADCVIHDCVPQLLRGADDASCNKLDCAPRLLRGDSNTTCSKLRLDKLLEHFAFDASVTASDKIAIWPSISKATSHSTPT
jgi:hypothetical protein